MTAAFCYTLRRYRLAIIAWGLALAGIAAIVVRLYATVLERMQIVDQFMRNMPPLFVAIAGEASVLSTPGGWLHFKFFGYLPVLLGVWGVLAGAGLFANDEERGRLDLLMAYPVSRQRLFAGRLLALVLATVLILTICWLGILAAMPGAKLGIGVAGAAIPLANALAPLLLYQMFALALSMVMPSKLLAASTAGLILVGNFFIQLLSLVEPAIMRVSEFLPLHYYRGGLALDGFYWPGFLAQLGVAALLCAFAFWRFLRRDIRVMGEGGWQR